MFMRCFGIAATKAPVCIRTACRRVMIGNLNQYDLQSQAGNAASRIMVKGEGIRGEVRGWRSEGSFTGPVQQSVGVLCCMEDVGDINSGLIIIKVHCIGKPADQDSSHVVELNRINVRFNLREKNQCSMHDLTEFFP